MKKWLKGEESKTLYYSYVLLTIALFCDRIVNEYILESDIVYDPATATRGIHEKKEKLKPPSMSIIGHPDGERNDPTKRRQVGLDRLSRTQW
jgi:hypothetical protein